MENRFIFTFRKLKIGMGFVQFDDVFKATNTGGFHFREVVAYRVFVVMFYLAFAESNLLDPCP